MAKTRNTRIAPVPVLVLDDAQAAFDAALQNLQTAHGQAVQALAALRQARIDTEDVALGRVAGLIDGMKQINRSPPS
ncbi:MAG TPA: hypothetical protein VIH40_13505 [Xanthobacteraceae bacterium]